MSDVTQISSRIESGDPDAADKLLPLVYDELRKLARNRMARESPDHTLQATALVHEDYLRLVGRGQSWQNRAHFFGAASEAMRRILVERARHKGRLKAGGQCGRVELRDIQSEGEGPQDLLALNSALEKLEVEHPRKAELVKLRFFGGLSKRQAAEVIGIAPSTADLDWAYAKCWLGVEMSR